MGESIVLSVPGRDRGQRYLSVISQARREGTKEQKLALEGRDVIRNGRGHIGSRIADE